MNKYEKEVQQALLDREKATVKRLEETYQEALNEINTRIGILLGRQDADLQHVIYQVEYQRQLRTQIQSILEQLQAKEFETVSEYLTGAYEDGFIGTMYNLQKQGIPVVTPIDQEQVIDAIKHESKIKESMWTKLGKDIKEFQKNISSEISRGISTGMMFSEIARNLAGYARVAKNKAMRIVRTEGHRIQCKAAMNACNKAKAKGADVVKQWDASLDGRTRPSHRRVDGEIRELEEPFSNGLMYPGDPSGSAKEVVNCRCALLQRARWAVGEDFTKWTSEDGIVEIKAEDYDDFKNQFYQKVDAMQDSQRVRSNAQKMKNPLENNGKSSTINSIRKSVKIPSECKHLLNADTNFDNKSISKKTLRAINDAIDNSKKLGSNFKFDGIKIAKFGESDNRSVMITDDSIIGGKRTTTLYLNRKFFEGKTMSYINKMCEQNYASNWWKSRKLEDLVYHEIMHARISYNNSYEKVQQLYSFLNEDDRVKGFCRLVDEDHSEFMNEMYVAIMNNEEIDQKYLDVYQEYVERYLGD